MKSMTLIMVALAAVGCSREQDATALKTTEATADNQNETRASNRDDAAKQRGNSLPDQVDQSMRPASAEGQARPQLSMAGGAVMCQPGSAVTSALQAGIRFADQNNDGRLEKTEASSLANFLIGGAFFRADQNNDGVITPKEGQQFRQEFMQKNSAVATLLNSARQSGENPFAEIANMVGINYGKPLSTAEARQAAQRLVNDLYSRYDANRDGAINLDEAQKLGAEAMQSVGDAAFAAADTNNDGQISSEELRSWSNQAVGQAFATFDTNGDGRLNKDEARAMLSQVGSWAQVEVKAGNTKQQ